MVSVTDPYGRIPGFLDRIYFSLLFLFLKIERMFTRSSTDMCVCLTVFPPLENT
jgi:hypothetical protein